ncbi:MAG: aminotransferase class V-fold PLP-dependent enzyme [Dehalococcoidia bacterium]|nr:aminotransferase class V-fold PLP-dependent enzyme [Dehalococcoidia bacterium]
MSDQQARWDWIRAQTPVMARNTYLNCGFSGAISTPVADAMRRRLDLEVEEGPVTRTVQDDKVATMTRLRALGARLLGADDGEVCVTGNTTEGVNIAVNGVSLKPGDRVVTTSLEHGGGMIPAYWAREKRGADLAIVHMEPDDGPGAMVEKFDQALGDRAALVILSEIAYSSGQVLPLRQVTEMAHARGATVVVDGAQTAGHIPVDVHESGVDAYAVPSHKWLCGPDGLGLLYVRRDRIADLDPVKVSARAAEAFDFEGHFTPNRDDIGKYEVSTMSTPAAAGMVAAIEQYLEHGPQAVWDRVRDLTRYAERTFEAIPGVEVTSPRHEETRSGLFLFKAGDLDCTLLAPWLWTAGRVVCRSVKQADSVRLSLHVYNNEADIERTADLVRRALAEGLPEDVQAAAEA